MKVRRQFEKEGDRERESGGGEGEVEGGRSELSDLKSTERSQSCENSRERRSTCGELTAAARSSV